jgi:broad specificity phosphatase PhoE
MTITLVRHGQTENNYLDIIQGSSDNGLLNDTGRRQCLRLKEKIKDKHFDYCYMSPLVRTVETAMILIGDRVLTIPDNRLVERGLGELEGRPRVEYNAYKFWDYDLNFNKFGVEPIQDVFKRCSDFLEYIKNKYPDKDILVVTHGAIYKALRYLLLGQELKGNLLGNYVDNCQMETFTI